MQEHPSKISFPNQGLAGIFRADQGLDQYGFFLNWRVVREVSPKLKTQEYSGECSPFYFSQLPPELETGSLIRVHLFCYSSSEHHNKAPIGCVVGKCEIKTDLHLVALKTLETSTLEFRICHILEYSPNAVDHDDLHLRILNRLNK